jgi:hypothetical protein
MIGCACTNIYADINKTIRCAIRIHDLSTGSARVGSPHRSAMVAARTAEAPINGIILYIELSGSFRNSEFGCTTKLIPPPYPSR